MATYKKSVKNKQKEQVFLITREGKVDTHITLVDLRRELARAKERVAEIMEDIEGCEKL